MEVLSGSDEGRQKCECDATQRARRKPSLIVSSRAWESGSSLSTLPSTRLPAILRKPLRNKSRQAGDLKLDLEMRYGTRVTANDVLWSCLCRHAAWLGTVGELVVIRPTSVHVACRMGETWHDSVTQCCSAFLIAQCTRVKPSGAGPGLASPRDPTNTCSLLKTGWIVLALSGGGRQSVEGAPWAPRVHEKRGRPRMQKDLLIEVTTVLIVADEEPAVYPSQGVHQN